MKEKHALKNNTSEGRYELDLGDDKAVLEYILSPEFIVLTHTYVPSRHEGQGIGRELVEAALEDIREKGLQVVPQCSFVARYILRHPEWEELVYRETVL